MNEQEVSLAAALKLNGASISELARHFGVARSTVSRRLIGAVPAESLVYNGFLYSVTLKGKIDREAAPNKKPKKASAKKEIEDRFLKVVAQELSLLPEQIHITDTLWKFGADSLDVVELVMGLEDEFGIEIPDWRADQYNVGDTTLLEMIEDLEKELTGKKKDVPVEETIETVGFVEPEEALTYLITPMALVVVRDGSPLTIMKDHKNFEKILDALKAGERQKVFDLIDLKEAVRKWSNGRVDVDASGAVLDGKDIAEKLTNRLMVLLEEGNLKGLDSLAKFVENTYENDRADVVDRLYDFLQATDIEIDEDGYVIAFKSVEADYLDSYTKTIDNSPGKLVSMPRARVNADQSATCVAGLHVMSRRYFGVYSERGNRIVRVRVHPADFVAIPRDYEGKARTCRYVVLDDVTESFYPSSEE